MNKYAFTTVLFVASLTPIINVYAGTARIECSNASMGGNRSSYVNCTSSSLAGGETYVYSYDAVVTCECPTDSTKLVDYDCEADYRGFDNDDDRDDIDEAYWIEGDCYEDTSSSGGSSSGGTTTEPSVSTSCEAGYFDNGGTCYSCAEITENDSATSEELSLSIMDCFIPASTTHSDSTGRFTYADDCYFDCDAAGTICDSYS